MINNLYDHVETINNFKTSIKKFDVMRVKVLNPKFGLKNQTLHISLKEYYEYMLKRVYEGWSNSEDCKKLLEIILKINEENEIEKRKLEEYWIKSGLIVRDVLSLFNQLSKENEKLNKELLELREKYIEIKGEHSALRVLAEENNPKEIKQEDPDEKKFEEG